MLKTFNLLVAATSFVVDVVAAPRTLPAHVQPNGQPKIKHMVVMLMENRAADHFFGCMAGEGVIGLDGINGSHSVPKDPNNASAGEVNVTCGTANYGGATPAPLPSSHSPLPRAAC